MKEKPVAVLDSGIGGLPYLAWLKDHLKDETLVYLADRKNFPYGEKTAQEVIRAVLEATRALVERCDPKLLVVACNTASVVALEPLRATFSFPIVGVVPAVKTAAGLTRSGRIGVLATRQTIEGPYLNDLIGRYCQGQTVIGFAAPDLVDIVEEDYLRPDPHRRAEVLKHWSDELSHSAVDTVVLACTHFLHVEDELKKVLPSGALLVDSRDGVGRRTRDVLESIGGLAERRSGPDRLYCTAPKTATAGEMADLERKYRYFAQKFALDFGGVWVL
ncbi:MAG: glutamate racemase [Spirochaetales bacterium]|nr:glutamate racemase [Spirochaetales bacterium]